jgi:predicted DCC family thiol-disulfide oxidoreductase YuxK
VLIEGRRAYTRSGAALRILRQMPFPWPLNFALIAVPAPLRDLAYDFFARRRYRWFGRRTECPAPSPEARERFLVD